MSGRRYRLTALADADIQDILANTLREFGILQFERYCELIDKAACLIGEAPFRPSSKAREQLGPAVRSLHVEIAAGRRGAASHILYYVPSILGDGRQGAVILRVLYEGMEPRLHVDRDFEDEF